MSKKYSTDKLNELIASTLLSNRSESIYFKDKESKFIAASQKELDYFGLNTQDEIIGTTDFDYFSKEHALQAFNDEQRIIRTGEPLVGIIEEETWQDSASSFVITSKYPLYDESGLIIGVWGHSSTINSFNGVLRISDEENTTTSSVPTENRIDYLTKLGNARSFYEMINLYYQKALNSLKEPNKEFILILLDLNKFTFLNATYGQEYGDQALIYTANILRGLMGDEIEVYRYSGDKFALLTQTSSFDEARHLCESLVEVFDTNPLEYEGTTIELSISIGMSRFSESLPLGNIHDIINLTDKRLYAVKQTDGVFIIYDNSYRL